MAIVLLGISAFGYYFFKTGGAGLYRIVVYYLISELPDKKYTWKDFWYKNIAGSTVSGFYSKGDNESFSLWTLDGLKKFYTKPKTSVYYFRDTCGVYKRIKETGEKSFVNSNDISFDIAEWNGMMKPEYFVTVQLLEKKNGKNIIENAWGVSGKYKVLGKIEEGVCD